MWAKLIFAVIIAALLSEFYHVSGPHATANRIIAFLISAAGVLVLRLVLDAIPTRKPDKKKRAAYRPW